VPLICSIIFAIGRMMFFRGYKKGASARAVGVDVLIFNCLPNLAPILVAK
jgi:hypothetical protein